MPWCSRAGDAGAHLSFLTASLEQDIAVGFWPGKFFSGLLCSVTYGYSEVSSTSSKVLDEFSVAGLLAAMPHCLWAY